MNKLYDIVLKTQENRKLLYFKGNADITEQGLHIGAGDAVDFLTYFNSFSISKWKEYTTIKKLQINGKVTGCAELEIYTIGKNGKVLINQQVRGSFGVCFDVENISGEILGIKVKANIDTIIHKIRYLGEFNEWKPKKIGVVICTYKREKYVKATIEKLLKFSKKNPWLTTLVVDNGSTLKKCKTEYLCIIHNPNYGGSGGFTRGIIENLKIKINDYVLLMDDDIDLEESSLEHTYGLLCGLKGDYKDSFLSGAMLKMNTPYIQHENTAYWRKIRLHSFGKNWDLTDNQVLLNNEKIPDVDNQYGAWWYCCIPIKRIEKIGLPLPVFVKGDDMEYGIRNNRTIIHFNGIGVWHEAFENKSSILTNYLSDRNMLIVNQYAKKCNRFTFFVAVIGRLFKRSIKFDTKAIKIFDLALNDMLKGFNYITRIPANEQIEFVYQYRNSEPIIIVVLRIFRTAVISLLKYNGLNKNYLEFRNKQLKTKEFWVEYLKKSKG